MPDPKGKLVTPVGFTAAGVPKSLLCDEDGKLIVSGAGSGIEIVDVRTVYNIGGGAADFADLTEAGNALKRLWLEAEIVLQLQANITVDEGAVFNGILAIGGVLSIDLNGFDYELNAGAPSTFLEFNGPLYARIYDNAGGGSVKTTTAAALVAGARIIGCGDLKVFLCLYPSLTIDCGGKAWSNAVRCYGRLMWNNPSVINTGGLAGTVLGVHNMGRGGAHVGDPASITVTVGGIWVDDAGNVITGA